MEVELKAKRAKKTFFFFFYFASHKLASTHATTFIFISRAFVAKSNIQYCMHPNVHYHNFWMECEINAREVFDVEKKAIIIMVHTHFQK